MDITERTNEILVPLHHDQVGTSHCSLMKTCSISKTRTLTLDCTCEIV